MLWVDEKTDEEKWARLIIRDEKETWWGKQKQGTNLEKMLQGNLKGKKTQKLIQ